MLGDQLSVEAYTENLVRRLCSLYRHYNEEVQVIKNRLDDYSGEVFETLTAIESRRFGQIRCIERVLQEHLRACSESFRDDALEKLSALRLVSLENNRALRKSLSGPMQKIKRELRSINLPGRAKNYRSESVPVLVDLKT